MYFVKVRELKATRFKRKAHILLPKYCRGRVFVVVPPEYKDILETFLEEKHDQLSH